MNDSVNDKVKTFFADYPTETFAAGELILFADKTVPPISYIISGRVGQYDIADNGSKLIMTIYKPGAFFPMANAVNQTPNKYFFEALEAVEVYQAPAAEVVAFVQRQPDVLFNLLQRLYRGTDGLLGRMSLLMNGSARSRVLFELSIAADRFGERQPDGSYLIHITESQLASQTGLARETVSRALKACAADGLLKQAKGSITLKF